ncbi:LacI family transcriptional regulator [Verrucomicrobia bacterium LW23]|nr:LacI family transcriptional regulator [Verrucomicrobia bacterium LW23]
MPNQRELAKRLGMSQSTVSLALRGSPLIAQATRERVRAAAAAMGYAPHPMVASLMERIRTARAVKDAGCIAILVDFPDKQAWFDFHLAYRQQYEAIERRAGKRGYRTECFFLQAPGMSPAVIDRILHARGIVGVILAGPRTATSIDGPAMAWERYAWIKSGYTWEGARMDCVSADNRQHVELAFAELARRGRRRVGYCISRRMVPRANNNWVAGYLIAQRRLPAAARIPMFVTDPTPAGQARFARWLRRWRPDAIIGGMTEQAWLAQWASDATATGHDNGTPPEFCVRWRWPGGTTCSIEENAPVIGETLCDLLLEKIIHNERGLPAHPRTVLIQGTWHEPHLPPLTGRI